MPKYMALIYTDPATTPPAGVDAEMMAGYAAFGEEAGGAGKIVHGEALQPGFTATTVTVVGGKGGEVVATDGPFAETKEVLGGYYLLDCTDLDEAIAWAAKIPAAWDGKVELRPIVIWE